MFQVTLIRDNNYREIVLIFHPQYLLVEGIDLLEGVSGCNGIYKEITLPSPHALHSHSAKNNFESD